MFPFILFFSSEPFELGEPLDLFKALEPFELGEPLDLFKALKPFELGEPLDLFKALEPFELGEPVDVFGLFKLVEFNTVASDDSSSSSTEGSKKDEDDELRLLLFLPDWKEAEGAFFDTFDFLALVEFVSLTLRELVTFFVSGGVDLAALVAFITFPAFLELEGGGLVAFLTFLALLEEVGADDPLFIGSVEAYDGNVGTGTGPEGNWRLCPCPCCF